jgi:hypothetical protein
MLQDKKKRRMFVGSNNTRQEKMTTIQFAPARFSMKAFYNATANLGTYECITIEGRPAFFFENANVAIFVAAEYYNRFAMCCRQYCGFEGDPNKFDQFAD